MDWSLVVAPGEHIQRRGGGTVLPNSLPTPATAPLEQKNAYDNKRFPLHDIVKWNFKLLAPVGLIENAS